MQARIDAMTQALLNEGVLLPSLPRLELQRDPRKGNENEGENPRKRQAENPFPKLVLGGNDRPRLDDLHPELSPPPSKIGDQSKTRDPRQVDLNKDHLEDSLGNISLQVQFDQLKRDLVSK